MPPNVPQNPRRPPRDYIRFVRQEIEQAVALLKSGRPEAVEQALTLLQNSVFSFSMRVCQQREDAEDTMQEVLVKSLPYLEKFDSPRALVVWLYKVAKNRCLMNRRRSKFAPKQELSLEELMPDRSDLERLVSTGPINPEMLAVRGEQAQRLRDAVQKLPAEYRTVLVLRDMEGLSDEEVAEITGLRRGTVRVRLHRARLFVRKQVMRQEKRSAASKQPPRPRRCKQMFADLSDYLDDELDAGLCAELEKHLADCEPCQAFVSNLESTVEHLRKFPQEKPDPKMATALREQLISLQNELSARR